MSLSHALRWAGADSPPPLSPCPYPVGPVQRCAVTLFCEIPLELKSILARTHQMLQGQDANLETEPNLALLVLYSTLLYRQSFAEWTQAETYLW